MISNKYFVFIGLWGLLWLFPSLVYAEDDFLNSVFTNLGGSVLGFSPEMMQSFEGFALPDPGEFLGTLDQLGDGQLEAITFSNILDVFTTYDWFDLSTFTFNWEEIANLAISRPFGGRIVVSLPCLCSGAWLLQLIPASPALPPQVMYLPGVSTLYQYGQVFRPGPHVLGTTLGAYPCIELIPVAPYCVPISVAPLIRMVGTSL